MEETGSFCSGVLWPMPVVVGGVKPLPHLCMAPPAGLYAAAHTPGVLLILQGPPTKPIVTPCSSLPEAQACTRQRSDAGACWPPLRVLLHVH